MLITLEGIDGSGKTTVWNRLQKELSSEEFVFTREPTTSQYGELLRENLTNDTENRFTELFLFMADHAHHVNNTIRPAINNEKVVICDRYIDSRCAYQGYTLANDLSDPTRFVYDLHGGWSIFPELTIFIDVDVNTSVTRLDTNEKFETKEKLTSIKENYEEIAAMDNNRFISVNGEKSKEEVSTTTKEKILTQISD
jgi:dTMP kinase